MRMQPEWWDIQLVTAMALPAYTRAALKERAGQFLSRNWELFKDATLHLHLKPEQQRIACYVHLYSDLGVFHTSAEEADVRKATDTVLERLEAQLHKHIERQAERVGRAAVLTA